MSNFEILAYSGPKNCNPLHNEKLASHKILQMENFVTIKKKIFKLKGFRYF